MYILTSKGEAFRRLGVSLAEKKQEVLQHLEESASILRARSGAPAVAPKPLSVPPTAPQGGFVIHIVAAGSKVGTWREVPAEDWVTLSARDTASLLPPGGAKARDQWEMSEAVSRQILTKFYPQTEDTNTTIDRNQFYVRDVKFKLLKSAAGKSLARIDGDYALGRSFYPGKDQRPTPLVGRVTGFMEFDPASKKVIRLQLVTQEAVYGEEPFTVAADSK